MLPLLLLAAIVFALLAVWLALEPLRLRVTRSPRYFKLRRRLALTRWMPRPFAVALIPSISGGSPELDEPELTEDEKAQAKKIGDAIEKLQHDLAGRLEEMKGEKGEDKGEVERREAELAKQVDKLIGLEEKRQS